MWKVLIADALLWVACSRVFYSVVGHFSVGPNLVSWFPQRGCGVIVLKFVYLFTFYIKAGFSSVKKTLGTETFRATYLWHDFLVDVLCSHESVSLVELLLTVFLHLFAVCFFNIMSTLMISWTSRAWFDVAMLCYLSLKHYMANVF